ncbi:MAG: Sua5/YciO/YrdC/YwlC family protein [Campylobacterales bacterium]
MTNGLFLAQSDTTVGFLSFEKKTIAKAKRRDENKPILITTSSFKKLLRLTRVPSSFKRRVRNSKKTTFIYPSLEAIRVVNHGLHSEFLEKTEFMYSSSANLSGKRFDEALAKELADIEVLDSRGYFEDKPSSLIKLGKKKARRLR